MHCDDEVWLKELLASGWTLSVNAELEPVLTPGGHDAAHIQQQCPGIQVSVTHIGLGWRVCATEAYSSSYITFTYLSTAHRYCLTGERPDTPAPRSIHRWGL